MKTLKQILRFFIRLLVVWFVDTISLLVTAWLLPGVEPQRSWRIIPLLS